MTKARTRSERPSVPGPLQPWITSYDLYLHAGGWAPLTVARYLDTAAWFAGWLGVEHPTLTDLAKVRKEHVQGFLVYLKDHYSQKYAHSIAAALQKFWLWWSEEEALPNPMAKVAIPAAPKLGNTPPPVIAIEQLGALIKDAEKERTFEGRRDAALLRMFAETGGRLDEITSLQLDSTDPAKREVTYHGKGGKIRTAKYGHKAALALDRYLRIRARHPAVVENGDLQALWLGVRTRAPMTNSGVRQMIVRRGKRLGLTIHPHLFRHTFADRWLSQGGAEGDLIELLGWESSQMLAVYGRSARGARARRAYDNVDVLSGV